ncbi:MAG TPA: DNA repair protein RecN [Clostridiales bacterium]|nr:DNA repair protein RecN [Clostridiales bacterium]
MIHSLRVENIALIDQLNIEFSAGLNVLSGETGAGKSVIVNSMNLILGERAVREMVRAGKEKAFVEAVLYLPEEVAAPLFAQYGIAPEEELIVSREVSTAGKNVCRINGNAVNLSTLKGFMDHAADLLGQHEHQSLLHPENHLALVDSFGGRQIGALKSLIAGEYQKLNGLLRRQKSFGGDPAERQNKADLLRFQVDELQEAGLKEGEYEALMQERAVLSNAQTIAAALSAGYEILYAAEHVEASVLSTIKSVMDELSAIAAYRQEYDELYRRVEESYYALEDAAQDIGKEAGRVSFDEQRQNEVEDRIELLNTLKRKYQAADADELLHMLAQKQEELDALAHSEELLQELEADIAREKDALYGRYEELHSLREKAAAAISKRLTAELAELAIAGARFEVRFTGVPSKEETVFSAAGPEQAEFYFAANAGEPLKPLGKVASGGEISRVMLAFKSVIAEADSIPTMIFDEIDTGISGHTAHVVAQKLAALTKNRQVICVTHLPQIAAMGDRNFLIEKISGKDSVNTRILQLSGQAAEEEIARMAGGMQTENALAYARELLEHARKFKLGV